MNPNGLTGDSPDTSIRLWRFAECEFDEMSRELKVKGVSVELEVKPLDVLLQLLQHAGEVLTKEELLEAVWPGLMVVDGSLATAVSKLRKALGDENSTIILTVPRVGYRLAVPVHSKAIAESAPLAELSLKSGQTVPGREQWQLIRPLDVTASSEVWLAQHPKTHEIRVFKFAPDGARLKGLKREVTVSRFLRESLGQRPEFVRVLEWNFDSPPFFLESEFCGPNLAEWAESVGGLERIPFDERLKVLADVAQAIASAHDVGVLHKDLKPANILVVPRASGGWQIKIADFGSASLAEPSRLKVLGITNLGFTQSGQADNKTLSGTLMYLAPEVLGGHSPTASADVYSLGVMLYQLTAGDFRRPLSPGWESDIADPLIREDIADAACGDPAKRLNSAAGLAERLLTLPQRRIMRSEVELIKERALEAERKLAEARARRPWVMLAAATLIIGLGVSLTLYRRAASDRDHANRQTAIAATINQFLSDDLLGRSNPFISGKSDETFLDAVKQSSPRIDLQFKDEPLIAARLHQTIARSLENRSDWADARKEYDRAVALFLQAEGTLSQNAIIAQLQRATMEAISYEKGSLPLAKSILAAQESAISKVAEPREDIPVWLETAQGMIALIENNAKTALQHFQAALEKSQTLATFDESARLSLKQRMAFANIRLGDGAKAEQLFRKLITSYTNISGPDSPNILRVRLNLTQAFMIQGKFQEAVNEANKIYPALVEKLGADHEYTLQLLSTRAQSEGSLSMWEDTIRDELTIYRLAVLKQGPSSFFAIAGLSDAALAQCRGNHLADGESNARKAYETSRKAFGENVGITGGAAYTLATCLIDLNKLDEASKLLDGIDANVVAQLTGMPDWVANINLARAEIAYRRGDFAVARKYVVSATPTFRRADAEVYQRTALETLAAALDKRMPTNK
jgi:serine/threonine protein kinase/DNA-binding winged helix-turn-helix (wHTH) protein